MESPPPPPIKVLQIVSRMNTGGVAVLLDSLMKSFDPAKICATLVTGTCGAGEEDYLSVQPPTYSVVHIPHLQKKIHPLKDFLAFFEIRRYIKESGAAIVHTHTSKAGLIGRLAASTVRPRPQRIHTFHGHLLTGYFSAKNTRLVYFIERLLSGFTDSFIAMGSKVKSDLQAVGLGRKKSFSVFLPGLVLGKLVTKGDARAQLSLDKSKIHILFVGRMTAIKRPDRLLDVAEIISKKHSQIHFVVAGDGELLEEIRTLASERELPITFLGWRGDISRLIAASDIAILTSDNEAVPLTMIEASLAGLPLVATNVGSVSDVVIDGLNGYLTDTSPFAIADALEKLVIDPVLREIMGTAGRERAARYFSLEKMSQDHTELYQFLHR